MGADDRRDLHVILSCRQLQRITERMEGSDMAKVMVGAGLVCCVLGVASLLLNAVVVLTLCRHTNALRKNVFYLIALHCGAVDFLRGLCLILWCVPFIIDSHVSFATRIRHTRMKQQLSMFLKTLNLLTIFNLFLFTINEFIVINRPIRYRHIFRRRIVKALLIGSWALSLLLCISMLFLRNMRRSHGIIVSSNTSGRVFTRGFPNATGGGAGDGLPIILRPGVRIIREDGAKDFLPLQYTFIFLIMSICYICLFTVLACYGSILHTIRRFRSTEAGGLMKDASMRCVSGPNVPRKSSGLTPPIVTITPSRLRKASLQIPLCTPRYGGISARHKLSEGTAALNSTPLTLTPLTPRPGSTFSRHIRQYLMNRHKYIMVIGMVLLVDVLYLVPYSIVQILSYLHIRKVIAAPGLGNVALRWLLQILIGLHAVCQPICYFRMDEFRRLVCRESASSPARGTKGRGTGGGRRRKASSRGYSSTAARAPPPRERSPTLLRRSQDSESFL